MKIVIYGASGATGHELVKQALAQQYVVTAFVRDPLRLKIAHPDLHIVKGNLNDDQQIENTIKAHDAVISALGAPSPFKYDETVVKGVNNIVKAMEKTGVDRLIYMSFVGVSETRHTAGPIIQYIAPKLLSTEIAGHEARENVIKQSSLRWTIVRPPTLTNGKYTGHYRAGENIKNKGLLVTLSRADVADFMLRQLETNTFIRKSPSIMP